MLTNIIKKLVVFKDSILIMNLELTNVKEKKNEIRK